MKPTYRTGGESDSRHMQLFVLHGLIAGAPDSSGHRPRIASDVGLPGKRRTRRSWNADAHHPQGSAMTERRPYPSDISDTRRAPIGPTPTARQQARTDRRLTGEPARTDLREVFNALLYLNRTGIAWKYPPHDLPPHGTVYHYY